MGTPHPGRAEHYFSETPSAPSRPGRIVVSARGLRFALATDRGTFSPGRLDPGTALLLDAAPDPPAAGRFVDLGCGYGPIACTLAQLSPGAGVVAVDVNERSRELCRTNARDLGLDNVVVASPEDVPADDRVDLLWSNPPIRIGKEALHDLLRTWLDRLSPTGEAVLVVNRHLGADSLHRWLEAEGHPTARLASKQGYRLLHTTPA